MTLDLNSGAGELYDLQKDPQENNNLFDDPANAATRSMLIEMIESRPNDTVGDNVPVGTA